MVTWKVLQMHLYPQQDQLTDVVFRVNWECSDTAEGKKAWITGNAEFTADPTTFTPYEDLTEDVVLGWVWPTLDKAEIEGKIDQALQALIRPPVVIKELPWNKPAEIFLSPAPIDPQPSDTLESGVSDVPPEQ